LSEACAAAYRVLGTLALSGIRQDPLRAKEQALDPTAEGDGSGQELP
jgi:hypothetical protein